MSYSLNKILALNRVAKLYLAAQFAQAFYFFLTAPVWYQFASEVLSPVQIGLFFSLSYATQLLCEVPTGALADKYGRKPSALGGAFLTMLVPLVMYFGHSFPAYVICAVLLGLGNAFTSGSLEALLYDHKGVCKKTYRIVTWVEITVFQTGLIIAAVVGGFAFALHQSLPFLGAAFAAAATFLCILFMQETKTNHSSISESYLKFFVTGTKYLLATKYLRVVVLMGVPLAVMMTASIEFINEAQMIEYGLSPSVRGLLIGGVKVLTLLILNLVLLRFLRHDRGRLIYLAITTIFVFTSFSFNSAQLFVAAFFVFNWISSTQISFMRTIIHDHLPSSHRATAMSGFSALKGMLGFVVSIVTGWLIEFYRTPRAAYWLFLAAVVIVVSPCAMWLIKRTDTC
jgi:MFS family permease